MFELICNTVFKLYLYADMTKMIHYSTDSNHCHEHCDAIRDAILEFTDDLAEQFFGYYGKPSFSDMSLEHDIRKTDDLGKLCGYVMDLVEPIEVKSKEITKLSGIVSLIDDFKGELSKLTFQATFDKVSNYKLKNN